MEQPSKVTMDRSAFVYVIASMYVVFGLMVAFMRSNSENTEKVLSSNATSTEAVLALLTNRAEVQEREDAQQNRHMDALNEEVTALRGRVSMLEAKLIKLESKQ